MKQNHYKVLEVEKNATPEEIKSSFRRLAKIYHPDNQKTGNKEKFEQILKSYEVLSNLEKRRKYDNENIQQATNKTYSYYQYTSYTKTEEREFGFSELIKKILRTYKMNQRDKYIKVKILKK